MRYLPPFEAIREMLNLTTLRGQTRVDMTYEDALNMIRRLLMAVEVDEAFYLTRNPDVAAGIEAGTIRSAHEHFVDHGYFEGRIPYRIQVDEAWYLEQHEDVARTVQTGQFKSGQEHFDGPGWPEGRRPFRMDF